jgi:hypothetical protein
LIQESTSDLNQGSYPITTVSSLSNQCFIFNWFVLDRPNRFSVYDSTALIWTSGWVGFADYSGPWGASLSTPSSGASPVLTFSSTSGRYVLVDYGPAGPENPLTDVAEWSLSCTDCTTTTTTTSAPTTTTTTTIAGTTSTTSSSTSTTTTTLLTFAINVYICGDTCGSFTGGIGIMEYNSLYSIGEFFGLDSGRVGEIIAITNTSPITDIAISGPYPDCATALANVCTSIF